MATTVGQLMSCLERQFMLNLPSSFKVVDGRSVLEKKDKDGMVDSVKEERLLERLSGEYAVYK